MRRLNKLPTNYHVPPRIVTVSPMSRLSSQLNETSATRLAFSPTVQRYYLHIRWSFSCVHRTCLHETDARSVKHRVTLFQYATRQVGRKLVRYWTRWSKLLHQPSRSRIRTRSRGKSTCAHACIVCEPFREAKLRGSGIISSYMECSKDHGRKKTQCYNQYLSC